MTTKIFKYYNFLRESDENEVSEKESLVSAIMRNINNDRNTMKTIVEDGIDSANIDNLNTDSDWFEFYLEFTFDVDKELVAANFFDNPLSDNGITSLYDGIIIATKLAVENIIKKQYKKKD